MITCRVQGAPKFLRVKDVHRAPGSDNPQDCFAVLEVDGHSFTSSVQDTVRIDFSVNVQFTLKQVLLAWLFGHTMDTSIPVEKTRVLPPAHHPPKSTGT